MSEPARKKGGCGKGLLIGCVAVIALIVVLAVCGGGGWALYYYYYQKPATPTEETTSVETATPAVVVKTTPAEPTVPPAPAAPQEAPAKAAPEAAPASPEALLKGLLGEPDKAAKPAEPAAAADKPAAPAVPDVTPPVVETPKAPEAPQAPETPAVAETPKAPEPQPVVTPAPTPAPTPKAAAVVKASSDLPANFPADVAQYPGAKLLVSSGMNEAGKTDGGQVGYKTADKPVDVANYFERAMTAGGWEKVIRSGNDMLQFAKGNRAANVTISVGGDGKTGFVVQYWTSKR